MMVLTLLLAMEPALIERHYNEARTLSVDFTQRYSAGGRTRTESGTLLLRKPARMRWAYTQPSGKLFVSDGKTLWFYSPDANRVEYGPLRESDDLRTPLAFLLGRLDFGKQFRDVRREGAELVAIPKSAQAPYREVRFTAREDGTIERLRVTGQDATVMEFVFANERRNVAADEALFRFTPPAGAEMVELKDEGSPESQPSAAPPRP